MSNEKRPEWMSSISGIVDPNDYLSGRKIDKTFELSQQEKAEKRKEIRTNLIAKNKLKLTHDPLLDLERKKYQLKLDIISNPIRLRKFRERLLKEEEKKQISSTNSKVKQEYKQSSRTSSRREEGRDYDKQNRSSHSGNYKRHTSKNNKPQRQ